MLVGLLIAGLATGVALGRVYRALVLVPTSLFVAVLTMVVLLHQGFELQRVAIEVGATVTFLQVGYLLGWLLYNTRLRLRPVASSSERRGVRGHAGRRWVAGGW